MMDAKGYEPDSAFNPPFRWFPSLRNLGDFYDSNAMLHRCFHDKVA